MTKNELIKIIHGMDRSFFEQSKDFLTFVLNNSVEGIKPTDRKALRDNCGQFVFITYNMFSELGIEKKIYLAFTLLKNEEKISLINLIPYTMNDKKNFFNFLLKNKNNMDILREKKDDFSLFIFEPKNLILWLLQNNLIHTVNTLSMDKIERVLLFSNQNVLKLSNTHTGWIYNNSNKNYNFYYSEEILENMKRYQNEKTYEQKIDFLKTRLDNTVDELKKINNMNLTDKYQFEKLKNMSKIYSNLSSYWRI